jgi:dynein heavy chain
MDLVDKNEKISPKLAAQDIIVTTIDKVRYSWMLQEFIKFEMPCLYVGPTGTGKSVYIKNVLLSALDKEKYITIEIGFSAQTSAN